MEGCKVAERLVIALHERGLFLDLSMDNLNVLGDRTAIKSAERLLMAFCEGSLTSNEQKRFSELEAAGVVEEEGFEFELQIIGQLQSSIADLEGERFDLDAEITTPLDDELILINVENIDVKN